MVTRAKNSSFDANQYGTFRTETSQVGTYVGSSHRHVFLLDDSLHITNISIHISSIHDKRVACFFKWIIFLTTTTRELALLFDGVFLFHLARAMGIGICLSFIRIVVNHLRDVFSIPSDSRFAVIRIVFFVHFFDANNASVFHFIVVDIVHVTILCHLQDFPLVVASEGEHTFYASVFSYYCYFFQWSLVAKDISPRIAYGVGFIVEILQRCHCRFFFILSS